ncbi:MAG: Transglycosylase associated protein, partial [uncultured Thermomicrobiales bacterium]
GRDREQPRHLVVDHLRGDRRLGCQHARRRRRAGRLPDQHPGRRRRCFRRRVYLLAADRAGGADRLRPRQLRRRGHRRDRAAAGAPAGAVL